MADENQDTSGDGTLMETPSWVDEMDSKEGVFWRAKYEELEERYEESQERLRSQQFHQRSSMMAKEAMPDIGGAGAEITVNTDPIDIFERIEVVVAIISSAFTIISAVLFYQNIRIIPPYVQIITGLIAAGLLIDYFWNRHDREGEQESGFGRVRQKMPGQGGNH